MAGLDYLFGNSAPSTITGALSSASGMPDWYQEYIRGIAGKGVGLASEGYQAYPGQRIADFNQDQLNAFQAARNNVGQWRPNLNQASTIAGNIVPTTQAGTAAGAQFGNQGVTAAQGAQTQANAVTAGPAQSWTNNWQQYMSPYTQAVTDEIARLGNQNLTQNVLPSVNSSFVGAGGFGSQRGVDALGSAVRDAQTNISGLQSQALQSGYQSGANIFATDANRAQQQQQLQADTALQGGQLVANATGTAGQLTNQGAQINAAAADAAAGRLGGLGQLGQSLGAGDVAQLGAVGGAQQALQQQGYDTAYQEFQNQQNYDWDMLNRLSSLVRGQQLPTTQTSVQQNANIGTSPLQWLSAIYGVGQTGGK